MSSRLNLFLLLFGVAVCSWTLARYMERPGRDSADSGFSMQLIPHPNLERLGAGSQKQINAARKQCEFLLAEPKNTDLLLRARAVAELGKHYHAYNFFDAAVPCYQFAQQWQPTEFRWPYLLGQVYRRNGQMDLAAKALERSLAVASLDMSVPKEQGIAILTWLGEIYLGANQIDRAESCLQRALEEDSDSAVALMKLGQIADARNDTPKAIAFFERVLEAAPDAQSVLLLLAADYRKNGETARAEQTLQRAKTLRDGQTIPRPDPLMAEVGNLDRSSQRFNRSGGQALAAGRVQQALQLFQQGLEIEPDNITLMVNMGLALDRLGDHQRAREVWQRVLTSGPNESALIMLGRSYHRSEAHEQALSYVRQALELKPSDAQYRYLLASIQSHAGRFDEALSGFGEALAADPAHTGAALGEIRMLAALERYDEALQRAERCRQELPDFSGATMAVARILAACPNDQLRDGTRALELARAAYDEQKTVASAETLAMAYAEVGDFQLAAETENWALQRLAPTKFQAAKARVQRQVQAYESKQVCRRPWASDDPYPAITRPLPVADTDPAELDGDAGVAEPEIAE